jgi:hypothetical protein
MSKLRRQTAQILLAGTGVLASVTAAFAAPVIRPPVRPAAVGAPRAVRAGALFVPHLPLRIEWHAFARTRITPLPLPAKPSPLTLVPVFFPAPGFAAPASPTTDACSDARSAVQWRVIPTTPFVPVDCLRDAALRGAPPSLAPGGNKNALYGRTYSPRDLDTP